MSTSAKRRGFTTAILHSDRGAGDRARRPAQAAAPLGGLRLPRCARSRRGVPGPRAGLRPTAARATRRRRRWRRRSRHGGRIATVSFATGMAAIGAVMLALASCRRPSRREPVSVRQHGQHVSTRSRAWAADVSYVDATDAPTVAAALKPHDANGVRGDDRQSPHAGGRPRAHRRAVRRAGAPLRRRQHDDLAVAVPPKRHARLVVNALTKYIGGHGNALGGAITDTGLFDWTRYPNIADKLQERQARHVGHHAAAQEGPARLGRRPWRPSRRITSPIGAETLALRHGAAPAPTRIRSRGFLAAHPQGAGGPLPGLARIRSIRWRSAFPRASAALLSFELEPAVDSSISSIGCASWCSSSNLGDNRTLAIPVAHTIFWEMGAARRAEMGIAESLIRVSVGIEDART